MQKFPRLALLARHFLAIVAFFFLSKVAFAIATPGISLTDVGAVWWHGLPLDLATAAYASALLWLGLLASIWAKIPGARIAYQVYAGVIASALALAAVSNVALYQYWGFPLDGTVLGYLDSPRGVLASLSVGQAVGGAAAVLLAALLLWGMLCWRLHRGVGKRSKKPRTRGLQTAGFALLGGLLFLAIRGGVGKSTDNVGMVYFSENQTLNHAAVNPAFSVLSSAVKVRDFSREQRYMAPAEAAVEMAMMGFGAATDSLTAAPLANAQRYLRTERPNVLIILMEGCGAAFVNAVNPEADAAVTPCLNALAADGSVVFTQVYANSFRTDRGTVAALSGNPGYPDVSIMKLPQKAASLPSIARSLRAAGYSTDFLYGGDINFTNTNGYLLSTGYERTFGDTSFSAAERATHNWGVTDSIVFDRLFDMISERPANVAKPWHTAMLTLASHEPWGVPYARIHGDTIANGMAYLDHCIGRFIARLKQTPQWANTLVVILPDHGIHYADIQTDEDPRLSHIPLIWTGGALARTGRIDAICNQSDLAATLLAQLGLPHADFPFSRDVLSPAYVAPTAIHTWSGGAVIITPEGHSALNLSTAPPTPTAEKPAPSAARIQQLKAYLQTTYDDLSRR